MSDESDIDRDSLCSLTGNPGLLVSGYAIELCRKRGCEWLLEIILIANSAPEALEMKHQRWNVVAGDLPGMARVLCRDLDGAVLLTFETRKPDAQLHRPLRLRFDNDVVNRVKPRRAARRQAAA